MRARKFWISGKPSPPSLQFLRHRRCCMHYLHEMFSDKWILNLCYLYRATDEVHNSFDLVSFSTLPTNHPFFFSSTQNPSLFLFTTLNLRIYCRGKTVIVHIKSRTVVSIHTSFPHMVHIAVLNIHDPMKYTWP